MYHGINELSKDGQGYVYWKDAQVEHYSFAQDAEGRRREAEAAATLAERCKHLENIGVPVSSNTAVWAWDWFATMPAHSPFKNLLARCPSIMEKDDGTVMLVFARARKAVVFDASRCFVLAINDEDLRQDDLSGVGGFSYHGLVAKGYKLLNAGQREHLGVVYANYENLVRKLIKHGANPAVIDSMLEV